MKKESKNKFIDNMRSMVFSLTQSINKISKINNRISQIDSKETDNMFIYNMRSMIDSLSQSINKMSELTIKYHKVIKRKQKINLQIT